MKRKIKKKGGGKKEPISKKNTSKKMRSINWSDHYTQLAKKDNYPARSVYKLIEIQDKFNIIRNGDTVLDLGCAPGSWLLYASKIIGHKGLVTGIDLKPVTCKIPSNAKTYVGNILNLENHVATSISNRYNVVLSDMAPQTTGRKDVDSYRSFELCQIAHQYAIKKLSLNGVFVCKIFQGDKFKEFVNSIKTGFVKHKVFKPESCRKSSKEIYIIGMKKKEV